VKDKENPQSFFIHCLRANRNGSCPKALGLAAAEGCFLMGKIQVLSIAFHKSAHTR
jgi:hypothetical protein